MPILRLNAGPAGLRVHGSPASALSATRAAAAGTGPVMILVHGFKYDPESTTCSPHSTIFGRVPHQDKSNRTQWLRHLGFGTGQPDEGLAIAFGWRARGNLWRAQRSARCAGAALAEVIRTIRTIAPTRPIHAITHSMGSEVIFEALHHLPAHAIQRIVAITGASYTSTAHVALQTPAGRSAEVLNVISRENDLFDLMFERLIAPDVPGDRALGAGLCLPHAVNIQLDCPDTLGALTRFGGHISAPQRRVCHWSGYTRPGALRFYARALRHADRVPLEGLQDVLPNRPAPRWSRIFAVPPLPVPLFEGQKTAS
ncbi:alpha/beta hydrolase [uncultured Tateyamaria sp.]|uniref:alpha/beta hydrolase n=1 Tax=uncultured Tateyamaria sp. TaxID=455651 RepID=UPI0026113679|nr:alpha/beta hydrolase [uncultured Tateyamaria sp.]